ncbi:hypothetical protein NMG60_11019824 [Bertholletia excelsa]
MMRQAEPAFAHKRLVSRSPFRWVSIHLLLLLVVSAKSALSGQIVKYLPGFDGELPFKLETGYISVEESEMFYYFVESEGNPESDPIFLWLTGGPGCTAFSGLMYEVGPMEYDIENYTGGLPKLRYYPFTWTKAASMIFLDSPVGTGFSYARSQGGWHTTDSKSADQAYHFLRKWLVEHPQYLSVQLFVAGDSYAGLLVPLVCKLIIDGNIGKANPYMNIKGYLVGSPATDLVADKNSAVEFAHRLALISDEIYENAERSCNGQYVNLDSKNTECIAAMEEVKKCLKDVSGRDILKPNCDFSSLHQRQLATDASEFLFLPSVTENPYCTAFRLTHNNIWANDESVQEALHVRKGTVRHWERCNHSLSYTRDISNVVSVHKELSRLPLEVLVESGDHDMQIPYVGTLKWIKSLNLTMIDNWRPWYIDDQVAGYIRKYSEHGYHLTFATLKGAGHPAPEYMRKECYILFKRWIHYQAI